MNDPNQRPERHPFFPEGNESPDAVRSTDASETTISGDKAAGENFSGGPVGAQSPAAADASQEARAEFVRSTFNQSLHSGATDGTNPETGKFTISQWTPDDEEYLDSSPSPTHGPAPTLGAASLASAPSLPAPDLDLAPTPAPTPTSQNQSEFGRVPDEFNVSTVEAQHIGINVADGENSLFAPTDSVGKGEPVAWENRILMDDVNAVSRMTGLTPPEKEIQSMIPKARERSVEDSDFPDLAKNRGRGSSREMLGERGREQARAKTEAADYDKTGLEELRTGNLKGKDGKKKGPGILLKILAALGVVGVLAGLALYLPGILGNMSLGGGERQATLTLADGSTVKNLGGPWSVHLTTTMGDGTTSIFQNFQTDLTQQGRELSGSGTDVDGAYAISGDIGDDGRRISLKKQYRDGGRFFLPIFLSGEIVDDGGIAAGQFYAHVVDVNGARSKITGQWQATFAPKKSLF